MEVPTLNIGKANITRKEFQLSNHVFVLDTNKRPLNPVHPGQARLLLNQGEAAIFRKFPFTIILKEARPMGLKSFLTDDEGEEVAIPQFYRKAQKRLKRLQRSLSHKRKGSSNRRKAIKRVGKAHLKVANQRKDFHYKTAKKLIGKGKHIGHEALNIKGLAKTRMSKSVNDAGWGMFLKILEIKAERAGLLAIPVNPNGTTQDCSSCGVKVPKTLADRWHSCPECGCELDRDHNAAINIKQRAVGHPVQALRGDRDTEPMTREARSLCEA